MKTTFLILVALAITVHVQGESCGSEPNTNFCSDDTKAVMIKKQSSANDNSYLQVTVQCLDNKGPIQTCQYTIKSPFPQVIIKSFQYNGNFKQTVQSNNNRNNQPTSRTTKNDLDNDDDEIETFD